MSKFIPEKNWTLPPIVELDEPFEVRYPHEVEFALMDICNLKCSHCYLETENFQNRQDGFLRFELFLEMLKRLETCIKNAETVNFTSVEALMHPNIFEIMDSLIEINQNINIRITTNGMLLNEKRVEKLTEYKNLRLNVSLDGYKKETVEAIKTGVNYDKLIDGMKRLQKYGIDYHTSFVVTKENINELKDYIPFCKKLGVSVIRANPLAAWKSEDEIDVSADGIYSDKPLQNVYDYYKECEQLAHSLEMQFFYRRTYTKPYGCGFVSYTMLINMEGGMAACLLSTRPVPMSLYGKTKMSEVVVWGNIMEEDPYKIWTNKECLDFRRIIHERRLPDSCQGCPCGELGIT